VRATVLLLDFFLTVILYLFLLVPFVSVELTLLVPIDACANQSILSRIYIRLGDDNGKNMVFFLVLGIVFFQQDHVFFYNKNQSNGIDRSNKKRSYL